MLDAIELQAGRRELRRCQRCGRSLSVYADPRDRYCAPCHPKSEERPGAALSRARWSPETPEAGREAGAALARRRWQR